MAQGGGKEEKEQEGLTSAGKLPTLLGIWERPSQPPLPSSPVTLADLELSGMRTLEHVAVTVTITHPRRGNLEIRLFCPSGIMSLIGTTRSMDS